MADPGADDLDQWLGTGAYKPKPDPYAAPPVAPMPKAPPPAPAPGPGVSWWEVAKQLPSALGQEAEEFSKDATSLVFDPGNTLKRAYTNLPPEVTTPAEAVSGLAAAAPGMVYGAAENPKQFIQEQVLDPTEREYEKAFDPSRGLAERGAHAIAGTVPVLGPALAESSEIKPAYAGEPLHLQVERAAVGWIAGLLGGAEMAKHVGGQQAALGRQIGRDIADKAGVESHIPAEQQVLRPTPEKVPIPAAQAIADVGREAIAAGEKLDPGVTNTIQKARAKLTASGVPLDTDLVAPEDIPAALDQLGHSPERIRSTNPAAATADLEASGLKLKEGPLAAPELDSPEFSAMLDRLKEENAGAGLPPTEEKAPAQTSTSLDDIVSGAADLPPVQELTAPELNTISNEARGIVRTLANDEEGFRGLDFKVLEDHLRDTFGDKAHEATTELLTRVSNLFNGLEYQKHQYDTLAAPADLQQRAPAAIRNGVKQWVAVFDKYGNEITPGQEAKADRVASWAEDPATGKLVPAGGISLERGEQHYLTHTRSLGLHDLPTDFRPIRAAADALGWKEAGENTSSSMAKNTYKKYIAEREAAARGGVGGGNEQSQVTSDAGGPREGVAQGGVSPGGSELGEAVAGDEGDRGVPAEGGADLAGAREAGRIQVDAAGDAAIPRESQPAAGAAAAGGPPEPPTRTAEVAPAASSGPPGAPTSGAAALQVRAEGDGFGGPPDTPRPVGGSAPLPEGLTEPRLKTSLHSQITTAAADALNAAGLPRDYTRWPKVSSQLFEQINSGELPLPQLEAACKAQGITVKQLLDHAQVGLSTGAREMAIYKHAQDRINAQIGKPGKAGKTAGVLDAAPAGMGAAAPSWYELVVMRPIKAWQRAIVSSWTTATHVMQGGALRVTIGGLDDAVNRGFQLAAEGMGQKIARPARPLESFRIAASSIQGLTTLGGRGETGWAQAVRARSSALETALKAIAPDKLEGGPLFLKAVNTIAAHGDLGVVKNIAATGVEGLESVTNKYLALHRGIDGINTRAVMATVLDGEVRAGGGDLASAAAAHNKLMDKMTQQYGPEWGSYPPAMEEFKGSPDHIAKHISEEAIQHAVEKTAELMSRRRPVTTPGRYTIDNGAAAVIKAINNTPLAVLMPLPGLAYDCLKFQWEHSPFGVLSLLSDAERAKMATGDYTAIAKAVVGTTALVAAIKLNDSKDNAGAWNKFYFPGTKTPVDIRPYVHFAGHFFIADILNKWKGKDRTWQEAAAGDKPEASELYKLDAAELFKGVMNVNVRAGTGLALVDQVTRELTSLGDGEAVRNSLGRISGTFLSGFLTPLRPVVDLYAQFDEHARTQRDTKQAGLTGPLRAAIPGASSSLPPQYSPTRGGPVMKSLPGVKAVTGLFTEEEQNPLENELSRLQIPYKQVFTSTGDPKLDNLVKMYLGRYAEEAIIPALKSPEYQALSEHEKGLVLTAPDGLLAAARHEALAQAMADEPERFAALVKHRQNIWTQLIIADQAREEAERQKAAGVADEPPEAPEAES